MRKFLEDLLTSVLIALMAGWAFMLAVGVIHHEWIPACPTIGYWSAVILAALVRSALYQHDLDKKGR
jgi:hypothetical protein